MGIDPGVSGGIAIGFCWDGGNHTVTECWAMPETPQELNALVANVARGANSKNIQVLAFLEKVRSSPQQGVVSAFTFGRGYGRLEQVLVCWAIRTLEIPPQQWQPEFTDKHVKDFKTPTLWKGHLHNIQNRIYPNLKSNKKQADAILICDYGCKSWLGTLRKAQK
jgi:hypothetical protein